MEKILTQEEIDALFRAAQGRVAEKPKAPAEERTLAACNFRQSARISKEQLRSVSQLHELLRGILPIRSAPTYGWLSKSILCRRSNSITASSCNASPR